MEEKTGAEKIATGIQTAATGVAIFSLVRLIILDIIIIGAIIFFILKGLPWYFGAIGIAFMILITVLQVIQIKRVSTARLTPKPLIPALPSTIVSKNLEAETGEKVIDYIAGIMRVGILPEGKIYGKEWLGKGEIKFPENTLILTNRRVAFIKLPIAGTGQIIAGTDISMWQWMTAKKDIENKLKEMMASQTLQEILTCSDKNFAVKLEDIKEVKLSNISQGISFISQDGKKYNYSVRDKKDFERAKVIFKRFLK